MRERASGVSGETPAVGTAVLYVADGCHWNDVDRSGLPVFAFVLATDEPPVPEGRTRRKAGEALHGPLDRLGFGRHVWTEKDGLLVFENGVKVRPAGPKAPWPATVVEYEFQERASDGSKSRVTRPALEVRHPCGYLTLHYPLTGPAAVAHDPTGKQLHSYHLEGEAEK